MNRLLAVISAIFAVTILLSAQSPPKRYGIGVPATPDQIAALDIDVKPDGTGLPAGSGSAREGASIYAQKCAACHGPNGEGGSAEPLVGAQPKNTSPFGPEYERWRNGAPDVPFTIGNYWPYATTIFDYIRRAMPASAPGSLSADETYSLVAWLLAKNDVIEESAMINAATLPRVQMPARTRFVPDTRKGGTEVK